MKLVEVKLTNFRGFANETAVAVDALTVLVGKNDAGKSSILDALDIFFNDIAMEKDDCCVRTESTEVKIACVFEDLPETIIIDEQYPTTLGDEYLLREDKKFELIKTYDCSGAKGKLVDSLAKASHPSVAGLDDLLSLKITELRAKARELSVDLREANQSVKAQIRSTLWASSADLQFAEREISLKKEAAKDVYEQIQKKLPLYALFKSDRASTDQDAEAQDPLKAAIKEAIRGREAELEGVIGDIRRELQAVTARTVEKIREMNPSLANELHPSVKNKNWDSLFNVTLTGDEDIPLNKRGSGTRRLVLLNFFRAKAEVDAAGKECGVIYAVEEPETSQHPNHQLMLLEAFNKLVEQGNCQILLTTHTPTLARRVDPTSLRLITSEHGGAVVEDGSSDETIAKIVKTLGVLPDHDVKVFFGVEGKHDISFLKQISSILAVTESDICDLDVEEKSGRLFFVPLGGSSLELWVNRLSELNRPEFYLTDRDAIPPAPPKYHQELASWAARGCTAWVTTKRELENYLHPSLLATAVPGYAGLGSDFDDVPGLFAEAVHSASASQEAWANISGEKKKRKESAAKKHLNGTIVAKMTPQLLTEVDNANEIRQWLRTVSEALRN